VVSEPAVGSNPKGANRAPVGNFSGVDEERPAGAATEGEWGVARGSVEDANKALLCPHWKPAVGLENSTVRSRQRTLPLVIAVARPTLFCHRRAFRG
jgi:hypothetical protein